MNPTASSSAGIAWLFWTLGSIVTVLAIHVSFQWIRHAQRHANWRHGWRQLLLAGATLGTGVCSAMVLSMTGAALDFPIGYRTEAAAGLWLGSMLVSAAVAAAIARSQHPLVLQGLGAVLGGLTSAVQSGWIWAAGFRPGSEWQPEWLVGAIVLQMAGFGLALWVAFSPVVYQSRRYIAQTLAAAGVITVTLIAGQELMLVAAELNKQASSIYADALTGWTLSMVCGVFVPLLLAFMAVDLATRRNQHRRRRRHRTRTV